MSEAPLKVFQGLGLARVRLSPWYRGYSKTRTRTALGPRRGFSLMRNSAPLGPYRRTVRRALRWS